MKWLVTGGCGFIGVNLIHHLRKHELAQSIRVVDNLSVCDSEELRSVAGALLETDAARVEPMATEGTELVVGDVRDGELALRAARGADVVVHLAACSGVLPSVEDPRFDCETNVLGTLHYLMAAQKAGCDKLVFASSGAPLGDQDPPIHEQKVARPLSPYGASKLAGEAYCSAFHGSYGLATVVLRFGNVYGPRSAHKQSVVAKVIQSALDGTTFPIYGDGLQTRDYVFVEDLARAISAAASSDAAGEVYQIATYRETSVVELLEALSTVLEQRMGTRPAVEHVGAMAGEIRRNYSDITKARKELGWEPSTALERGLAQTVDWFLEHRP